MKWVIKCKQIKGGKLIEKIVSPDARLWFLKVLLFNPHKLSPLQLVALIKYLVENHLQLGQ